MKNLKKNIITTTLLILSIPVAVAAVSDLVKEYKVRKKIVYTNEDKEVFDFLKANNIDLNTLTKYEIFAGRSKFLIERNSNDVCFGDLTSESIECYNKIGIQTLHIQGDAD